MFGNDYDIMQEFPEYHVILLLDVNEDTADNATHGQLRLYAPGDYAKAMETLVVPDGMYCPSIQL